MQVYRIIVFILSAPSSHPSNTSYLSSTQLAYQEEQERRRTITAEAGARAEAKAAAVAAALAGGKEEEEEEMGLEDSDFDPQNWFDEVEDAQGDAGNAAWGTPATNSPLVRLDVDVMRCAGLCLSLTSQMTPATVSATALSLQALCPPSVFEAANSGNLMRTAGDERKRLKAERIKADVTNKDIHVIVVGAGLVRSYRLFLPHSLITR